MRMAKGEDRSAFADSQMGEDKRLCKTCSVWPARRSPREVNPFDAVEKGG